ncbi:acyltransferase family protein [Flavobacterium sp.]|jgi:peptidoglycan/LPS O-acetylase OafA/YrhL|uniref:acyltransferase family protein n=1 Tax=Flavobacterium sp. TaxID=239 RepID=UPI0037C0F7F9
MNKIVSFYLDLLRILSAFYVFIFHVGSGEIDTKLIFSTPHFSEILGLNYYSAHYFVIVFFVLSGYLITMSASRPNISVKTFITARLGRLYSVLIPALFLSFLVAKFLIIGNYYPLDLIKNNTLLVQRFILNATFLSQSWSLNATPPLNNPFWSVQYEFMYYLIIASWLLVKNRLKYILILLIILISGLKVMMLFPCWLLGSLLYYLISKKKTLNFGISVTLFFSTLILLALILSGKLLLPFEKPIGDHDFYGFLLFFSWNFKADLIFSFLVATNVFAIFGLSKKMEYFNSSVAFKKLHSKIQIISNCSYTLYLFHLPLLFLFSTIVPYDKTSTIHQIGLIFLVLLTVYFIAKQTEWKVELWRGFVEKAFNFVEQKYIQLATSFSKNKL